MKRGRLFVVIPGDPLRDFPEANHLLDKKRKGHGLIDKLKHIEQYRNNLSVVDHTTVYHSHWCVDE